MTLSMLFRGSSACRPGRQALAYASLCLLALSLQACGGGGGGESTANASQPPASSPTGGSGSSGGTENHAPTISGKPTAQVSAGGTYAFAPTAADVDNDKLTFSITNKPDWAAFDAATGKLTGTPSAAGTFANVTISVSDGSSTATLDPFAVEVTERAASTTGSATISWTPPTERTDGSALTNLAGYHVRYGTNDEDLTSLTTVDTAGVSSIVIDDLAPGTTYYFVVSAYDASGAESQSSPVVSKTIG